jgi:hypothetical protein
MSRSNSIKKSKETDATEDWSEPASKTVPENVREDLVPQVRDDQVKWDLDAWAAWHQT